MKQVAKANWLSVIKDQKIKEQKLHAAQLCAAGHCTAKKG